MVAEKGFGEEKGIIILFFFEGREPFLHNECAVCGDTI